MFSNNNAKTNELLPINIQNKYKDILQKIQLNKNKYPNICNLWTNMIMIKYDKLNTVLNDAENMLDNIDMIQKDMTQKEMVTILMMHNLIKNKYN